MKAGLTVAATAVLAVVAVLMYERTPLPDTAVRATPSIAQGSSPAGPLAQRPLAQQAAAPANPASALYNTEKAVAEARARGAGEDEVYRIRTQGLPAQTIAMLAEREQAEKDWARRLQAWRQAAAALPPGDTAGHQRLREQMFSEQERALLATAERSETPQLVLE